MPITVNVDTSLLERKIRAAQKATKKPLEKIIRNVAINFSQSAAKESKPEPGNSYKRLSKKAKVRPFIDMPTGMGSRIWWFNPMRNSIFVTKIDIPKWLIKQRGLVRIKKAVLYWNKKANDWDWFGYVKGFTNIKRLRIPRAGLGKWGWLGTAASLGKGIANRFGSSVITASDDRVKVVIHNKVRYASKISEMGVLGRARDAAIKMIDKVYFKKEIAKVSQ